MGVRSKRRWLQIKRSSTRQALQSMLADKRTLKRPNCSICVAIQPSGELCLMSQIVPTSSHAQNLTGQTVNYFGPVLKGADTSYLATAPNGEERISGIEHLARRGGTRDHFEPEILLRLST